MSQDGLRKLEAQARHMKLYMKCVDYVLFPVGCVLSGFFVYQAFHAATPFWLLFDCALFFWTMWTNLSFITALRRSRKLRNHSHEFIPIISYHHAETDEDDPICHTAFNVLGCRECGTAFCFPLTNAVLTTRRFRKQLYADMKRLGWKLPEF